MGGWRLSGDGLGESEDCLSGSGGGFGQSEDGL